MPRSLSRRRPANPEPEDDDEDYPATARGDEDEQAEVPRSRRGKIASRSRDDDEDERPARSRRSRDEDDEDERPARNRRSRDEDDEDERPSRSRREAPQKRRSSSSSRGEGRSSLSDGWDGYKKAKAKSAKNFEDRFQIDEKDIDKKFVIMFLQDKPITSWNEHFLRELPKGTRKSWTCYDLPESDAIECPICEIGQDPAFRSAFNIAVFDSKGNPVVKYWIASPGILSEIEQYCFDADWLKRNGSLDDPRNYFVVSKSKGKGKSAAFQYRIDHVKARDLEEEHDIVPLTADELDDLQADLFAKKDVVKVDSLSDLEDIAAELS